jgi:hypothetical protein
LEAIAAPSQAPAQQAPQRSSLNFFSCSLGIVSIVELTRRIHIYSTILFHPARFA